MISEANSEFADLELATLMETIIYMFACQQRLYL